MKIEIRAGKGAVSDRMRTRIERRLALVLARFAGRIKRVIVRFSKVNPGSATLCRLEVILEPRTVEVEEIDADLYAAADHAAGHAARSVARLFQRDRSGPQE